MVVSEKFWARSLFFALAFAASSVAAEAQQDRYVGSEVCAGCHRAIYDTQAKTAMAETWRPNTAPAQPLKFAEGALRYEVQRAGDHVEFSVAKPGKEKVSAPVSAMVGGKRHGISYLLSLDQIDGISLERPALIEGRYAVGRLGTLVLSPGFQKEAPADSEDALGRVLNPTFEPRCLSCHGQPGTLGAGQQGGVRCESCHGPASAHVDSVSGGNHVGNRGQALVRPKHLSEANSLEICAQCHSGLSATAHTDPMPEDLIVSSQVLALRHSECFIQSGEKLVCTACHNPHEDSAVVEQTSVAACLRCHAGENARDGHVVGRASRSSAEVPLSLPARSRALRASTTPQHAAICPVNRTQGCVGCHMPKVHLDSFQVADHWIRAIIPAGQKAAQPDESLRSQVVPKREFLRLIMVDDAEKMKAVTRRLSEGESFSTVAHDLSMDASAPGGGYIGDTALSDMDAKLAATVAHLPYGGTSDVIETGNRFVILQRQPRDFRWEADRLFHEATDLKDHGDLAGAIAKDRQALEVYPYLLRGLVMMATTLGQAGKMERAAEILRFAVQSYPKDALSQFDLAMALSRQPTEHIEALRKTLELDPDMVAAYQSLGAALYATGQAEAAIQTFRRGLQVDPLSAILYYDLGLALQEQGDSAGARKALALAAKIDPQITAHNANAP
jgi:tetratricopeptide (TPR) repeat protein